MYRPSRPVEDHSPDEPDMEPDAVRNLLFSTIGALTVWLLAVGLMVPAGGLVVLLLPEQYAQLMTGFGLWLVLGLVVFHWWTPTSYPDASHSEGLAIAGWHVLTTLGATGVAAWLLLMPDGVRPAFTIGDVFPVVVIGGIILVTFGTVLTLLRGYAPGRGLRYAWTQLCLLATWMTLWLVAAHGGL